MSKMKTIRREDGSVVLVSTSPTNKDGSFRKKPVRTFLMEDVRSNSLAVLGLLKGLTQEQRQRVLRHSIKINKI